MAIKTKDDSDPFDFLGDPSMFGLDDPTVSQGDLNQGFGGGGQVPDWLGTPGYTFDANQGSNFDGSADPWGGLSAAQLANIAQLIGRAGTKTPSLLNSLLGPNPAAGLVPMLLGAGGALLNHNATSAATQQAVQGLTNASTQATNLIGGAQQAYQPYMQTGTTALSKLAATPPSNIAGMFKPLGSGKYLK